MHFAAAAASHRAANAFAIILQIVDKHDADVFKTRRAGQTSRTKAADKRQAEAEADRECEIAERARKKNEETREKKNWKIKQR